MDGFDIGRITDADFEALCRDLLGEALGVRFELFAPGKDGGVDLRYAGPSGEIWIVQCKHWAGSGRAKLLAHMANKEKRKVDLLKPDRYLLATSVNLNPADKSRLFKDLAPWVRNTGDLWGLREIEEELRARDDIVRRHIRLWLNSTAVLQAMLTNSIKTRSRMLAADTELTLRTYVPNPSLSRALELLDEQQVCIVTGAPGVGKTALAQVVAAAHVAKGFELIEISEDVEEAFSAWRDEQYQIYYYDDFLGQTTLDDKLRKNEESRLLQLLEHARRNPRKRVILTTREYILAQARQRYERLGRADFDPLTCVIDLADYQFDIRAQVLYNHIYFASLSGAQKAAFANPAAYLPILRHQNFSPRVVALALTMTSAEAAPNSVPMQVRRSLDDPGQIWAHIVENQLGRAQVTLLEAAYSIGPVNIEPLRKAWRSLARVRGDDYPEQEFRRSIEVLDGTLLRIFDYEGRVRVALGNPSVGDFMAGYLLREPETLAALLRSAVYYEQMQVLWTRLQRDKHAELRVMVERQVINLLYANPLAGSLSDVLPTRFLTAFYLADLFEDEAFRAEVIGELADNLAGIVDDCADLYVLVDLVGYLRDLDHDDLVPVLEEADDAIRHCLAYSFDDWDSAREAKAVAEELGLDIDYRLAERIDAAIVAGAVSLVERWREGDQSVAARDDLEEILASADAHYVENHADQPSDDRPDPTRELRNFLALAEDHRLYWRDDSLPDQPDRQLEENVARLFAGLLVFAEQER